MTSEKPDAILRIPGLEAGRAGMHRMGRQEELCELSSRPAGSPSFKQPHKLDLKQGDPASGLPTHRKGAVGHEYGVRLVELYSGEPRTQR